MKYLLVVLLVLAPPLSAQVIVWDPDRCVTCRDSRQHAAAGATLDMLARGPWIAPHWRDRAWKRVGLATGVGAAYELMQSFEVKQSGQRGPGYGFGFKDLACDLVGAIAAEGLGFVWRKIT